MKKVLFFDVDGTLVDFGASTMSKNTSDALIAAKKNGHKIFLCTGRSYNQIYPSLKAFDFDGTVAAAGGYVVTGGKVITHHVFGADKMQKIIDAVGRNNTGLIFQTKDGSITNSKWADKFVDAFSGQFDMTVIQDNPTFKDIIIDDDLAGFATRYPDVESTIYCNCDYHIDDLRKILGNDFVVSISRLR